MQVTIDIPDEYAEALKAEGKDPAREALETLLVEAYRTRRLHTAQIKRILGYGTRMQVHGLLKDHGVPLDYGVEDFEQDLETLRSMKECQAAAAA
jgi:predicted HTH domain antitoxin